jgi:hypothetical protein
VHLTLRVFITSASSTCHLPYHQHHHHSHLRTSCHSHRAPHPPCLYKRTVQPLNAQHGTPAASITLAAHQTAVS